MERDPEQVGSGRAPEPKPARFIWPPKRINIEEADRAFASQARQVARAYSRKIGAGTSTVEAEPQSVGAIFEEASSITQAPDSAVAQPSPRERSLDIPPPEPVTWSAFEHAWLGVTSEPWSRRREVAAMDAPGAACWRCASPIGLHEATDEGCSTCRDAKLPWKRLVRVGAYEGQLRDAIREVKFKRFSTLGIAIGSELGRAIFAAIRESGGTQPIVLVPVAMPLVRRLRRGVDHSKAIAVGASRELRALGVDARVAHLLSRRHRPSQLEVAPSQRFRNAAGSFVMPWHLRVWRWVGQRVGLAPRVGPLRPSYGGIVVVIDDVRTTGATMSAACREMRRVSQRAGCGRIEIWGGVVAVASHRGLEQG